MPKITGYRYDDQDYEDCQIISARGDSFKTLTADQKKVELAIRATLPEGTIVRGTSLYTWANEDVARRLWPLSKKKHFYELEVDSADVRHKGDLNHYSEAVKAVTAGKSPQEAVDRYCSGEEAGPPYTEPRMEVAERLNNISNADTFATCAQ